MNDLTTILSALDQAARRLRWKGVLRSGFLGLCWGSTAALVLTALYHFLPFPHATLLIIPALPVLAILIGGALGWRTPSRSLVARQLDSSAHLQERLGTAVEWTDAPESDEWRRLILADAASRLRQIDQRELIPLRLPKSGRWSAGLLALCTVATLLPVYRSPAHLQREADAAIVERTGRQLAELTRHSLETRTPALEPVHKSLDAVMAAGAELERKTLTRAEALQNLAGLSDKLQEQAKQLAAQPAMQRLEEAARKPGSPMSNRADLQRRMEAMQQELGTAASPEQLASMQARLEKLQQQAQAASQAHGAGEAARDPGLADAMSALSRDAQALGISTEAIDSAIAALAASKPDKFVKDLQAAIQDLEKMREMASAMKQLREQMGKLGKDLAEQLQAGQVAAAQNTLQEMIRKLESASLSQEQLQKLMEEVREAVNPAGDYGKVSEFLQQAQNQMKAGQKGAAKQSLQQAARELAELKQQFDDLQQLAQAMENLNCAGACIGTGKSWGQCRGAGDSKGIGAGVGTWAADGLLNEAPQMNKSWDNSGVNRPDVNPRGLSEREIGTTEGLKPDQVKGQISQGAPMPSIPLRGLSIRGQSTVALEQAAGAAQVEAQEALSQDRVPRAYQGPVRDYFDDLKK